MTNEIWSSMVIILFCIACNANLDVKEPVQQMDDNGLILFLCGDVMTGRGIDQVLPHSVDPRIYESYLKDARGYVELAKSENELPELPLSYSYIWGDAMNVWKEKDPVKKIINLETAVTDFDEPWPQKGVNYRMHPQNVELLTTAGFDFASLANNHTMDWKAEGLLETMRTLDEAGLQYAGAGQNIQKAVDPAVLSTGNGRIIIYAAGMPNSGISLAWQAEENKTGLNVLTSLNDQTVKRSAMKLKM